ncbi:MAG: hypothetical protein LBI60_00835 [Bacteroidales bacterium]|nr:hypothetical protein [Bacteroidales bacterium]
MSRTGRHSQLPTRLLDNFVAAAPAAAPSPAAAAAPPANATDPTVNAAADDAPSANPSPTAAAANGIIPTGSFP